MMAVPGGQVVWESAVCTEGLAGGQPASPEGEDSMGARGTSAPLAGSNAAVPFQLGLRRWLAAVGRENLS